MVEADVSLTSQQQEAVRSLAWLMDTGSDWVGTGRTLAVAFAHIRLAYSQPGVRITLYDPVGTAMTAGGKTRVNRIVTTTIQSILDTRGLPFSSDFSFADNGGGLIYMGTQIHGWMPEAALVDGMCGRDGPPGPPLEPPPPEGPPRDIWALLQERRTGQ